MVRGTTLFYCAGCRGRFMGLDVELAASILSQPLKCPHCGSWHTRPWSLLPARIADRQYEKIWANMDRRKN